MEQKKHATVAVVREMIDSCKSAKDITELPAVSDNWIRTFDRCHGRNDGALRYEREKILFAQAIDSNDWLGKSTRFSQYIALMRMAMGGVSLDDGQSSLIRRGAICTLHIQWKGRRAQIQMLPQVVHLDEPVVVYDCDCNPQFTPHPYNPTRGMKGLIINDWQPVVNRPENAVIKYVYVIVTFKYGMKAYDMDRDDVLQIRDEYSESYKTYAIQEEGRKKAAATGQPWPAGKVWDPKYNNGNGGWKDQNIPMWVNREAEAWKKTMIHRLWKSMEDDKSVHIRRLDEQLAAENAAAGIVADGFGDDPADNFEFSADFQLQPQVQNITPLPKDNPAVKPVAPATHDASKPPQPVWDAVKGEWVYPSTNGNGAAAVPANGQNGSHINGHANGSKSIGNGLEEAANASSPVAAGFEDIGNPNEAF
jgi:hypothetical protein